MLLACLSWAAGFGLWMREGGRYGIEKGSHDKANATLDVFQSVNPWGIGTWYMPGEMTFGPGNY